MKIKKDYMRYYNEDKYQTFEKNFKEPKGLNNKEGNCYMNSLLQCFYYCCPMTIFFLSSKDKCRLGVISKSYYDFVHCLHSGSSDAALSFQKVMMRDYFTLNEEKDLKELPTFMLSKVNEELKENNSSNLYKNTIYSNPYDLRSVYEEKLYLDKNNNSIIAKIFFYDILYIKTCNKCKHSKQYDIQSDMVLTFELDKIYKKNSSYPNISIIDCLENYFKEEIFNCPFCNRETLGIKKLICSLQEIFIFVMSRDKNDKVKINFPLKINMENFYEPINKNYEIHNTEYELICGTFKIENHNISICKNYNNGCYYSFNDSEVRKINFLEIFDKNPYILFYKRSDLK